MFVRGIFSSEWVLETLAVRRTVNIFSTSIEQLTIAKDAPLSRRDVVQGSQRIGRAMYAQSEDDHSLGRAKMQRHLIGLTPLASKLSDSDFFDLTLSARTLSGIVGVLSFEHSVRLQRNCRNVSVDRVLEVCE